MKAAGKWKGFEMSEYKKGTFQNEIGDNRSFNMIDFKYYGMDEIHARKIIDFTLQNLNIKSGDEIPYSFIYNNETIFPHYYLEILLKYYNERINKERIKWYNGFIPAYIEKFHYNISILEPLDNTHEYIIIFNGYN